MKGISILSNISNILKIKLVVFILCCLIGSFLILYYYKYINFFENTAVENIIVEGFNTSAPLIERKINKEPVRFASFYGGDDVFHLNSLLFFDDKGQLLQYGKDYRHYANDRQYKNINSNSILFNNDPDKKNTYYNSRIKGINFETIFTHPQSTEFPNKIDIFLSRIYIRNRLQGGPSGDVFYPCDSEIHHRIKNFKLQLVSVVNQSDGRGWRQHRHGYNNTIFEYRLGDDGNLMKGPNYDVIINFMPYVDPAIELKRKADALAEAAKAAKDAEAAEAAAKAARLAEEARQKSIEEELTKVIAYEQSSRSSKSQSDSFLTTLQKYTTDTKFMTEPIELDVQTTEAIKKDSIIQVSRNNMKSNVDTTTTIYNNVKNKFTAIEQNFNKSIDIIKLIRSAYYSIIFEERKLMASNTKLADLKKSEVETIASKDQIARFNNSRQNILSDKELSYRNIIFANVCIGNIFEDIRKIQSSEPTLKQNLKIVEKMRKMKRDIMVMTIKNKKANNEYKQSVDAIGKSKQNSPESIFSNQLALGALT